MLKVMIVIDGLWVGGTERSLAETLPALVQAHISPLVVCFRRYQAEGVEREVQRLGIDVRFVDGSNFFTLLRGTRRLIQSERPQVVHTSLFNANLIGSLAALGLPTTVLNSLVNMSYEPVRYRDPNVNPTKLRIIQQVDIELARYCVTHFHAVSKAVKQAASQSLHIAPERITVVERGRDADRLGIPSMERRRQMRHALGLQEDQFVLINVGREEYQKGQRYLVEAVAHLVPTYPQLLLLIVGRTGYATPELRQLCTQHGLENHVRFLGHRADVPDLLAASDLFVFPSLYEGLPGAVLEAMALGLPIVGSNIEPVCEVVEEAHNAFLVEPTAPNQIADAIKHLIADRRLADAFGLRSRQIFAERFTLEHSTTGMIDLYYRVATMNRTATKLASMNYA